MACSKIGGPLGSCPPSPDLFGNSVVFELIMDYVGTDHGSLLASRLVSHQWNETALYILKRNGAVLGIGGDRTPFINQGHSGQGSKTKQNSLEYLKNMNNRAHRALENPDDSHHQLATAFDQLPAKLYTRPMDLILGTQIMDLTPARTITAITCDTSLHRQRLGDSMVWQMAAAAAPTLKSFGLIVTETLAPGWMGAWLNENRSALNTTVFSKLVNFWIQYCDTADAATVTSLTQLSSLMIGQSPSITKFRFGEDSENSRSKFPAAHSQLRKLLPSPPEIYNHGHELEVPLCFMTSITPEKYPGYQNLQLLKLVLPMYSADLNSNNFTRAMSTFLAQNPVVPLSLDIIMRDSGKDLESLVFFVCPQTGLPRLGSLPIRVDFPQVHSLVHFGIGGCGINMSLMVEILQNVARQCPNVKSMSMHHRDFGCLATIKSRINAQAPVADEFVPWYTQVTFPGVQILQLTGHSHMMGNNSYEISGMLNTLFPVLNEIVIDNEFMDGKARLAFQALVTIRGVRELEFKAYYENWLGKPEVGLEGSELANSLERLKLGYPDQTFLKKIPLKPVPVRVSDLEDILKDLPNLKELEIDHKLMKAMRNGSSTHFSAILNEVQQIRKQFPNVDVKLM